MIQKHRHELETMEKVDSSNDSFRSAEFGGRNQKESGKQTCESVDIFESIKDDEYDEEEYRIKTRRRLIIIAASSIILVLLIIGAIIGILVPIHAKNHSFSFSSAEKDEIKAICSSTLYPNVCYSSIYSLKMSTGENPGLDPDSPAEIFMLSLQVALNELVTLKSFTSETLISFRRDHKNESVTQNAVNACEHLMEDAIDHLNMSISSVKQLQNIDQVDDLRTWLSTAITDQETCLEGLTEFRYISHSIRKEMNASMQNAAMFTSNSLAIITKMSTTIHRKVLQIPEKSFTRWMHRRLLEAEEENLRPNLTVAKDGSGDYRSITEAVSAMPKRSKHRFIIYVKESVYEENVVVDTDSWNLMIYGDGMNKTIVSGSLNYADGVSTYNSGTFIAEGRGFIAKDMGFNNMAGPKKFQAVALRSSSDQSFFHRCSFDGYQDTLYTHTNRQYFRECLVTGTIDFIFGNAAVVFNNCTIQPRQPRPGQYNTVTAQSKSDPNQNTGISIQQCSISPLGNLTARTFLGRPWNVYSTTVIMETEIQGIIDPAGWIPWDPVAEVPDTIFYAEYKNTGPGSILDGRVTWAGYRPDITEEEAEKFSVEQLIQGNKWLTNEYYRV